MFCGYCGKMIPDGAVCDCEGSKKAMGAQMGAQMNSNVQGAGPIPSNTQGAGFQGQNGAYGANVRPAGPSVFAELGGVFSTYFKHPAMVADDAYTGVMSDKAAIGTGVVYAIVTFISMMISYLSSFKFGKALGYGLLTTLIIVGCRVAIAAIITGIGSKNGAKFKNVFKVACATTIPLSILLFAGTIFTFASAVIGALLFLLWFFIAVYTNVELLKKALEGTSTDRSYWFSILLFVIYLALLGIIILIAKSVVMSALSSSFYRFF